MRTLWFKINLWKYYIPHNLLFLFLILIIYKIYIYDVIGSIVVQSLI